MKQKLEPRVLNFQVNILWICFKHFRIEFNISTAMTAMKSSQGLSQTIYFGSIIKIKH